MKEDIFSIKNYNDWNGKKIAINDKDTNVYFKEGDIWWCSVGLNIGSESSGKGTDFRRPVLIYKKLSSDLFVAIPLSSKSKVGTWFANISFQNKDITALLYQIRNLNKKRLSLKMGELDEKDFSYVKEKLELLLEPSLKCHSGFPEIDGRIPKSTSTISKTINMSSKKILLFGDSLTWGVIAGEGNFRFKKSERIAGFLQDLLGKNYEIIEEGRPGRTAATDDRTPSRNGLTSFENAINSHSPLDYIFIMLGTNDIKNKFNKKTAEEVAQGFSEYRDVIEKFNADWEANFSPTIIIVAPPVINESFLSEHFIGDMSGRYGMSRDLSRVYSDFVSKNKDSKIHFLDASHIRVSKGDGVHLDVEQNKEVAQLYFNFIKKYED